MSLAKFIPFKAAVLAAFGTAALAAPASAAPTSRFIVTMRHAGALARRADRLTLLGRVTRLGRVLGDADYAVVDATPAQVARLRSAGNIAIVSPDRVVRGEALAPLDVNRAALGVSQVNGDYGYSGRVTGSGVGVAVLDSGINAAHPDLLFGVIGFKDFVNGRDNRPYDDYGHGTHIAGLIAGSGLAGLITGTSANYRGVAPAANLVGVKVLNAQGAGRVSDVIAGLDWCVAHKKQYNLRVINLSLSTNVTGPAVRDPLCQAAERAVHAGLIVVASAGNLGGAYGTVGGPGNDLAVITVGASNTGGTVARGNDTITSYTGRGPTAYDVAIKPDLVAPGNDIISLRDPGATIDAQYGAQTRVPGTPYYARLSGTSMSTALVSGAAALLVSANPDLTPNGAKAVLVFTAQVLSGYDPVTKLTTYYDPFVQGAGELNIVGAVNMATRIQPGVGFGAAPTLSSLIGGETAPWAGATIPVILSRPNQIFGTSLLWDGNTGHTISDARVVWGSNIVWGGSDTSGPPPPLTDASAWSDTLVWGNNIVWGGSDTSGPPPPIAEVNSLIWANNIVWGGSDTSGPPPPLTSSLVNANNIVWGGSDTSGPPPPIVSLPDPTLTVGSSDQSWGGTGLVAPDPVSGLRP